MALSLASLFADPTMPDGMRHVLETIDGSEHIGLTIADTSLPGTPFVYVNQAFLDLTGYRRDEVVGRNARFLHGPGTKHETIAEIEAAVEQGKRISTRILNYRADRTPFWNEVTLIPLPLSGTGRRLIACVQFDVSAQLRRSIQTTFCASGCANGASLVWLPATNQFCASPELYSLLGATPGDFNADIRAVASLFPLDQQRLILDAWRDATHGLLRTNIEIDFAIGETIRYLRLDIVPTLDASDRVERVTAAFEDSAHGLANERRLRHLAYTDQLTGLFNRSAFVDSLELLVDGGQGALILIDLDHFKTINDTLGHDVGDFVLRELASRLRHAIGSDDVPARLGGDEFALIVRHALDADELSRLCTRLIDAIDAPIPFGERQLRIGASIGAARFPDDADNASALLKNADIALYRAKARGRGCCELFLPQHRAEAEGRSLLAQRLRNAADANELVIHFQPQVDVRTGRLYGTEVLTRWPQRDGSFVAPADFIAVAESEGLIVAIGDYIIRRALQALQRWIAAGIDTGILSINIGTDQLRNPEFARGFCRQLDELRIPPRRVALELSEAILIDRFSDGIAANVTQLNQAGVRVAIDDFGTGWMSLSHLRRLPLNHIKVDRSFVVDLETSDDDARIYQALINLAHSLGLCVVAEGVETEGQLALLRTANCDLIQGYLIGKPMDEAAFLAWIDARRGANSAAA